MPSTTEGSVVEPSVQLLSNTRITSSHKVLLMIAVIVICASSVRLLTYDRFLPYIDYVDEPHYVALADEIRGFSDQSSIRELYGLLSPLYVYTNVVVHTIHDFFSANPWHIPGEYYYTLRLLSVFFGVCTALTIAWIGWQLGGKWAALISGLVWAFSPIVVELNNRHPRPYALPCLRFGCCHRHRGMESQLADISGTITHLRSRGYLPKTMGSDGRYPIYRR